MNNGWKYAVAGALGGAVLALVIIFATAAQGLLPVHLSKTARDEAVRGYLMAHPEILIAMSDTLQARQQTADTRSRQAAIDKIGLKAFFDPAIAFVTGPKNAATTIVEFYDYNCPYCRASAPAIQAYYKKHKNDTRFSFVEFPIKGPDSTQAARAAIAAQRQPDKYVAFHFSLMNEKDRTTPEEVFAIARKVGLDVAKLKADMKDPRIDKQIDAVHKLAQKAGIDGTPTFIIDGNVRPGAIDDKILSQMTKEKAEG
jgi:protein-disulfide isomerase